MKTKLPLILLTLSLTMPLAAQTGILDDVTKTVDDTAAEAARTADEAAKAADEARKAAAEEAARAAAAQKAVAEEAAKAKQAQPPADNPVAEATGADQAGRGVMKQVQDPSGKVDDARKAAEGRAVTPADLERRMAERKGQLPDTGKVVREATEPTTERATEARRMAEQRVQEARRNAEKASEATAKTGREMRTIPGKSIDDVKRRMISEAETAKEVAEPSPKPEVTDTGTKPEVPMTNPKSDLAEATPESEAAEPAVRTEEQRGQQLTEATGETLRMLTGTEERDRDVDRQEALSINSESQASRLVTSILSGAIAGRSARGNTEVRYNRLAPEEAGRTRHEREQTVNYFVNRFEGRGDADYRDQRPDRAHGHEHSRIHYYDGNRRVVRYRSRQDIPPILIASSRLNWVEARPVRDFTYINNAPQYYQDIPEVYSSEKAYGVSYKVDPKTVVSRDDILFRQGSTAFRDAYSFDVVADLAEAMLSSGLRSERFVIEGHASAEGSYGSNLDLSQRRAERIARDLVAYGVAPERLVPVGYGETEAAYPADARESLRSLDRRVMVFRLID